MTPLRLIVAVLLTVTAFAPSRSAAQDPIAAELDAYWAEVSRTVVEGDFDGYAGLYHPDAVLVDFGSGQSYPIAQALDGWQQGFVDTADGRTDAGVDFRLTRRLHDATTAHETGMFGYWSHEPGEERQVTLVHMEALLVKRDGAWKMIMELQKELATEAEWEAAGP